MVATSQSPLVAAHAARVEVRSDALVAELGTVVVDLRHTLGSYLRRSLDSADGTVKPTSRSALAMRDLDRQYTSALSSSGYHAVVAQFVGNFSDQVDEARAMYSVMQGKVQQLPAMPLTNDDGEVLATRAALSLAALDATTVKVVASLRQVAALALSEVSMELLVEHVMSVVDRTQNVGPLAKDLEMGFFRTILGLVYRNVEDSGTRLMYTYAGLEGPNNRQFCEGLIGAAPKTRVQINLLDNGKVPGVFDNCGGPGCSHFWWAAGAA